MAAITRTVSIYEVVAYTLNDDNPPVAEPYATVKVSDTSMNDRKARIALRDCGVALPKNCVIKFAEVDKVTYSMTIEQFVANAEIVNA